MSKLLIIGNGFDLKLEVPSRFEDYFNNCLETNNRIITIIQRIKSYKLISRSTNEKVYYDNYNGLKNDFNELFEFKDVNLWFLILYFNLENNYNQNWSDIETILYSFLFESLSVNDLKSTINRVIFQNRFVNTNINELEIYTYFLYFKYKVLNNSSINIFEYLMYELNSFEDSFSKYLSNALKGKEYYKKSSELFNCLVDTTQEFNVLNFNYTNPEKYNQKSKIRYINNVHGSLRNKNIIIGIDYEKVELDPNLKLSAFDFTKTSRIIHNINENSLNTNIAILDRNIDEIIIYGHSLSNADYSYYQSIFDFYDLYHSNIKLCFKFSIYDSNLRSRIKQDFSNRVIKLILTYGGKMDNKDHGKNLLHKLLLENRVIIQRI